MMCAREEKAMVAARDMWTHVDEEILRQLGPMLDHWSLFGLSRAREQQGRTAEADEMKRQYDVAWKDADAQTVTSCKCIPAPQATGEM